MEVLSKHWDEYTKRIKPILRILKEENKKDLQDSQLLKGWQDLIDSYTKNMNANMTKLINNLKKEIDLHEHTESKTEARLTKVTKLTKPAKVPTRTKKMSLEKYTK